MAVSITVATDFRRDDMHFAGRSYDYDPHRDRFLMVKVAESEGDGVDLRVILNAFDDL